MNVSFHFKVDGWMNCNFMSFSTVFQSYQDKGIFILKGCVPWKSVYSLEHLASSRDEIRSARSVGQQLAH